MDSSALIALFIAASVNAAIPGPSFMLVVARAARGGRRGGYAAMLGTKAAVGVLLLVVWAVMVGTLELGEPLLGLMKFAGVVVLAILGFSMLRTDAVPHPGQRTTAIGSDFAAGLLTGLSSPFNLIFFLALLPQFIDPTRLDTTSMAIASGAVLLGSALPVAVAATVAAGHAQIAPRGAVWVVRAGGAALLGFSGLAAFTGVS